MTSFAETTAETWSFPFPYLIYSFLTSNGVEKLKTETFRNVPKPIDIGKKLLKGNKVIDLPLKESLPETISTTEGSSPCPPRVPAPGNIAPNVGTSVETSLFLVPALSPAAPNLKYYKAQLPVVDQKISLAEQHMAYLKNLLATYQSFVD